MDTIAFTNAPEALAWLADRDADVVVTDMHMPEMDGVMLAQALHKFRPKVQLVLLTSGTLPVGSEASEFARRLLKPYRQSQLFNILSRILYTPGILIPATVPALAQEVLVKNQTVLVANDNLVNIKVAVSMLKKTGLRISKRDGWRASGAERRSIFASRRQALLRCINGCKYACDGRLRSRTPHHQHARQCRAADYCAHSLCFRGGSPALLRRRHDWFFAEAAAH
jgi:CheY-like chemotaxis protein